MNVHLGCAVPADARKGHPILELELKMGVRCPIWVLRIDLRFSARAASIFNFRAVSLALGMGVLLSLFVNLPQLGSSTKREPQSRRCIHRLASE